VRTFKSFYFRQKRMITNADISACAAARSWPKESDPEFWSKVARIIDDEIEDHADQLKDWWVVRRVPFWYPSFGFVELNYMSAVAQYYLRQPKDKRERWQKGLQEPYLGHTQETYDVSLFNFGYDSILTGTWPIKNAHHIAKWEQHSGREVVDYDHIIEIGAGLGDMPRFCYDVGYRGTYTVLDLAPTCRIQQAYLRQQYPVRWVQDVAALTKSPNTLVIATWSLSEIGYAERERICRHLSEVDWLVAFQCEVMGLYNVGWFPKFFANLTRTETTFENIPFHGFQGGSFYCYGRALQR
jgi:hypothetical protein